MKENKDIQIKVRITASQKESIDKYCAASGLNISQLMRLALNEILGGLEK